MENLIGKKDTDFNPNHDEVERFLQSDREVLRTQQPAIIPEEFVTLAATGEQRWYQTIKIPLKSPDGTIPEVLGVTSDITERKRGEQVRANLAGRTETILLVEHEVDLRNMVRGVLADQGYNVLVAADGIEAVEEPRSLSYSELPPSCHS